MMTFLLVVTGIAVTVLVLFLFAKRSRPFALIDLVEVKTPEAKRDYIARVTQLAEEVGGHRVLANEALQPVVIPDERAEKADYETDMLVITLYPTKEAGETALGLRNEWFDQYPHRTYAARPVGQIDLLIAGAVLFTLGLFHREAVPAGDDNEQLESLIEASDIVNAAGIYQGNWTELLKRSDDQPIWMLNFLEFAPEADYGDNKQPVAPTEPISGADAYERYGQGMLSSLAAVGGRIGWKSTAADPLPGTDDGQWHEINIGVYPSTKALMTMYARPQYRIAHVNRLAGLARTRLLATRPIAEDLLPCQSTEGSR